MESSSSDIVLLTPGRLAGTVAAPPSKSAAHRAILCAALSALSGNGSCFVHPLAASEDITVTLEAAKALGCQPCRIAKTLSFKVGAQVVLIVCAGDVKIDNRKYKDFFHTKAAMFAREETEALTGHAAGGICPFALNDGVKIYLDVSLKRFSTVFPACGSPNSAIELSLPELEQLSGGEWIDVCKLPA